MGTDSCLADLVDERSVAANRTAARNSTLRSV